MILELGDGRELKLPDDMDEEIARQLGKLILATEQRATAAEQGMQELRDEVQALRDRMATPATPVQQDNADIVAALHSLQVSVERLLRRSIEVQGADRVIVHDSLGTPRSRIAPQTGKA